MKSFSSLARIATMSPSWTQIIFLILIGVVVIYYPPALKFFNRLYQIAIKLPQLTAIIVAVCLAIGIKISNPFEPPVNPDFEYVPDETQAETPRSRNLPINKRNVSAKTKKLVASRQNWRCGICGRQLDETFEVDHIIPLYKGGSNEMDNLVALDPICHRKKTRADRLGLKITPVKKPNQKNNWGL